MRPFSARKYHRHDFRVYGEVFGEQYRPSGKCRARFFVLSARQATFAAIVRGLLQYHGNGKLGAYTLLAFHIDVPVHQFHDALGDREPKPRAAVLAGVGFIFQRKSLEHAR